MSSGESDPQSYVLGDSGWNRVAGLRIDQAVAVIGGALIFAVGAFVVPPLVAAVLGGGFGAAGFTARVYNVPVFALAGPSTGFVWRWFSKRLRWDHKDLFGVGLGWERSLPPPFAGLEPYDVRVGDQLVRFVWDTNAAELSLVVPVTGDGFGEATNEGKDAMVGEWGQLLSSSTELDVVERVTWQEWVHPASQGSHGDFVADARRRRGVGQSSAAVDYDGLVGTVIPDTLDRERLVVLTGSARSMKGRTKGRKGLSSQLLRSVEVIRAAGPSFDVGRPFGPELVAGLRSRMDPRRARVDQVAKLSSLAAAVGMGSPEWGAMAMEERFGDGVAVDGSVHRPHFVAGYPRRQVGASWFETVSLGVPGVSQTVSMVMVPVAAGKAEAQESRRGTSTEADVAAKHKAGFRARARDRRAVDEVESREDAIADGQGLLKSAMFVTVSADSWEALDEASSKVMARAAASQLDLWPMCGRMASALCVALPVGRSVQVGP